MYRVPEKNPVYLLFWQSVCHYVKLFCHLTKFNNKTPYFVKIITKKLDNFFCQEVDIKNGFKIVKLFCHWCLAKVYIKTSVCAEIAYGCK